jgi:hypothetical protein
MNAKRPVGESESEYAIVPGGVTPPPPFLEGLCALDVCCFASCVKVGAEGVFDERGDCEGGIDGE